MNLFKSHRSAEPESRLGPGNPRGTRVLVVEDSTTDAMLAGQALERFGIGDWHSVRTAEEALDLLSRKQYQVVMTDFNLPGMNGLDLLKVLRDEYPDVRVIVVTGARDEQVAVAAMKLGAADYVSKDEFLTSGIVKSIQTALRSIEVDRRTVLKAGHSLETARAEAHWLCEPGQFSHADLATSATSAPDELRLMVRYLRAAFDSFPQRTAGEQGQLLSLLVARGSSPRALVQLFSDALDSLHTEAPQADLPVGPTLFLAELLRQMVEEYQSLLAATALQAVSGQETR